MRRKSLSVILAYVFSSSLSAAETSQSVDRIEQLIKDNLPNFMEIQTKDERCEELYASVAQEAVSSGYKSISIQPYSYSNDIYEALSGLNDIFTNNFNLFRSFSENPWKWTKKDGNSGSAAIASNIIIYSSGSISEEEGIYNVGVISIDTDVEKYHVVCISKVITKP